MALKETRRRRIGRKNGPIYYLPSDTLPDYADYPADIRMPVFAFRIDSTKKSFCEGTSHKHDEFELFYVSKGSVTLYTENSSIHISAGRGAAIRRGISHFIEPDLMEGASLEIIHFHHTLLFGTVAGVLAGRYLLGILDNADYEIIIFDDTHTHSDYILNKMHEIYDLMQNDVFGNDLHVIADLYDIWAAGLANYKALPSVALSRQQVQDKRRIARATAYISEHYMEDIVLSEIAEVCKVCNSECCRTFRRALHMSPMDYINRYRVYTAAELLTKDKSNTPMSEIALKVGFNYASYFNKTFKRYLGETPLQYRAKHNEKYKSSDPIENLRI